MWYIYKYKTILFLICQFQRGILTLHTMTKFGARVQKLASITSIK